MDCSVIEFDSSMRAPSARGRWVPWLTRSAFTVGALLVLGACGDDDTLFDAPVYDTAHVQAGGSTTVNHYPGLPYDAPARDLKTPALATFAAGQAVFEQVWQVAPETPAAIGTAHSSRLGLGPLYNADSCAACHPRNGRGSVAGIGLLLRLSRPLTADGTRFAPDPVYGEQLQHRAVPGLAIEASMRRTWRQREEQLADGSTVTLREPFYQVESWNWGDPDRETSWSARLAPALIGLGLLEAIPDAAILAEASSQSERKDKISGQPSWVLELRSGQLRLGRFGWKAQHPTVEQQVANALQQDIGLSTIIYPASVCTPAQTACHRGVQQSGAEQIEVPRKVLDELVYYARHIAVPAPRNVNDIMFQRGRLQFHRAGCAACHRPSWTTEAPPGGVSQKIWPFTDLLLHDLGSGLAAPNGEGDVAGVQWRTAPLWGIGLALAANPETGFLHDGRARTLLEAVLWHGGEAQAASDAVRQMSAEERDSLLTFLRSL